MFNTGMFQYDNQFVVLSREVAQRFTGLGDAVSGIDIRVTDPWKAPGNRPASRGDNWAIPIGRWTGNPRTRRCSARCELEKVAMGFIIFFIMVVAAFNIVGTLTMVVAEKTREIGILQAMGLQRQAIARIFLAQGAIIGLVGVVIGLVGGLTIAFAVDRGKWIRINPTVYFIDHLPIHVESFDVGVVVVAELAARGRRNAAPLARGLAAHAGRGDPPRMSAVLVAQGVRKVYEGGDGTPLEVLAGVDLEVRRGEFVAIVGASGAGKSTLLHLLGALDRATEGRLALDGVEYAMATDAELGEVRNRKLGFIFQFHHLLREFTALENVMMPLLIGGRTAQAAEARARELLDVVGLASGSLIVRRPCRAESSSGSRWPGPWPTTPTWFWPTSPPAISTTPTANACTTCSPR